MHTFRYTIVRTLYVLPQCARSLMSSFLIRRTRWRARGGPGQPPPMLERTYAHTVVDVKMTFVLGARNRLDDEQEKSGLGRTDEE